MTAEIALRFVLGGLLVSMFAVAGELFQPKTFAGLFGAAPSVAIATLGIAYRTRDAAYLGIEARSMLLGATAFVVYAATCVATTKSRAVAVSVGAAVAWAAWAAVAFMSWQLAGPSA